MNNASKEATNYYNYAKLVYQLRHAHSRKSPRRPCFSFENHTHIIINVSNDKGACNDYKYNAVHVYHVYTFMKTGPSSFLN